MLRHTICLVLALALDLSGLTQAYALPNRELKDSRPDLSVAEQRIRATAVHDAEFAMLFGSPMRNVCQANSQPQALATPDPLLGPYGSQSKITVSFIVGTDGRIQSPLILSSDDPAEDRDILRTVRSWRYRPALCNGVPTEAEARVEFSKR